MALARYNASESSDSESSQSSESSSSTSRSRSPVTRQPAVRNLSWNSLVSLEVSPEQDDDRAANRNGKDKERIKQALSRPCCQMQCKKKLGFKQVLALCIAFWSLSKTAQDSLQLG